MCLTARFLCLLLTTLAMQHLRLARGNFDVRRQLASKTRYAFRLPIPDAPWASNHPDPQGYEPVHMWLLARHGTRWPTHDRMKQINTLTSLFQDARNTDEYPWLKEWQSPVHKMSFASGELHGIGEDEMWMLAYRLRKRYPTLVDQPYFPKRYPITSTQVPRAAASASAFASGFFPQVNSTSNKASEIESLTQLMAETEAPGSDMAAARRLLSQQAKPRGFGAVKARNMGPTGQDPNRRHSSIRPQAVAITMAPKRKDPLLRFYDMCPQFAQHEQYTEQWMASWMASNWTRLVPQLQRRLQLSRDMDPCEVEALWTLCQFEAGIEGNLGGACQLFNQDEVLLLEWLGDIELLETHGYGAEINYKIASPLLNDIYTSLKAVAEDPEPVEKSKLHFAHCETLIPLATLMGLFKPDAPAPPEPSIQEIAKVVPRSEAQALLAAVDSLEDISLKLPHKAQKMPAAEDVSVCPNGHPVSPDDYPVPKGWYPMVPFTDDRLWRAGRIAPFGANMALVLYRAKNSSASISSHKVRLLYNEQVVQLPNCNDLDCDLDQFLEAIRLKSDPAIMEQLCEGVDSRVLGLNKRRSSTDSVQSLSSVDSADSLSSLISSSSSSSSLTSSNSRK